jgi:hypothetical protein
MSSGGRNAHRSGWSQTAQFRAIARAAIKAWNAERPNLPKCGATAKGSGEPCKQVAMENGRCAWHGGKTGRKDQWHLPQWPVKSSPNVTKKMNRKIQDRERQARKRAQRLAAMTPEERQRHAEWQKAHRPGPASRRAAERARRAQNRDARERFARVDEPPPQSAEVQALAETIEDLRYQAQRLKSGHNTPITNLDEGIFG